MRRVDCLTSRVCFFDTGVSPLSELHIIWASFTLSHVWVPPLLIGCTWSIEGYLFPTMKLPLSSVVLSSLSHLSPQIWHTFLSLFISLSNVIDESTLPFFLARSNLFRLLLPSLILRLHLLLQYLTVRKLWNVSPHCWHVCFNEYFSISFIIFDDSFISLIATRLSLLVCATSSFSFSKQWVTSYIVIKIFSKTLTIHFSQSTTFFMSYGKWLIPCNIPTYIFPSLCICH